MKSGLLSILIFPVILHYGSKSEEAITLTTRVGDYAVLNCEIDFPQGVIIPHVLQWRKDNELIFSCTNGVPEYHENFSNRISLLSETEAWQRGRGSINITSIRETDEGWYECRVIFPNRTPASKPNGTWFHLFVEGGSFIAIPPTNETTMEGNSINMKCVSKMFSATVTWYKDGKPVYEIEEMKERIQVLPEGSLYIADTDMKDSGYYLCEITNENGDKQSAGSYLNVQFKAKVVYAPRRVYLAYGKPGHLECYYRANPEITKIRWEKDGFLFDAYNVPGVFARRNGSLYFSKVDDSHSGEYTCTPYNDLGTNGPSPRMNVIVQKAPVFTVTPHILYLRKIGESVEMPCDAIDGEGVYQPSVSWSKKNGEIPRNRSVILDGNLTIVNIQLSDRGSYLCVAKNEAGTITSEAELLVEETVRVQAPYNVTTDVTKNSVTVKWFSEEYSKNKLKFSVWYRSYKSQNWKMTELNNSIHEVKIGDLISGETYDVMVLSQNDVGDGIFSKTMRVTTKKDEPQIEESEENEEIDREFRSPVGLYQQIGPPTDIYIQIVDEFYKLMWKPPRHGLEMLKYYKVIWYKEPSEERIGAIETISDYVIIRNLEEQKTYKFQVFAVSTNDYEAPSVKYLYHVPSFPVKKPFIIGAAAGALIVTIISSVIWYFINPRNKSL